MIIGKKEITDAFQKTAAVNMYDAVSKSIKTVQAEAKTRCPVNDGELRGSIYTAIETSSEKIVGICYTNKKYAQYVEFGTGPKGQKQHAGISPDVAYAYVQSPWWIHESMIGRKTAEKYKWFYVDTPDGRFYQCTGQAAQPFLYPALKNNELEIAHYPVGKNLSDIQILSVRRISLSYFFFSLMISGRYILY